jgi:Ser/Thr protein kinase RdoA (MazF antagonist)
MERKIKEMINDQLLSDAAKSFDISLADLKLIGGFQNFIYQYEKNKKNYILRITHSTHRDQNSVKGELEWVNYLHDNNVSVSKPVLSRLDNLIEIIELEDNSYFIVTSFEKAPGEKSYYPQCMNNDSLSEICGEITGQIHALSRAYQPTSNETKRHDWTQNYYLKNMSKFIPLNQTNVYGRFDQLKEQIKALNKEDNFGLIHGDINVGNFFLDNNTITLFDFDECQYSWFVEDIAIQLFYMTYVVLDDSINERNKQARQFVKFFLKGYQRNNLISEDSLKSMELFLRLRELIVYVGMYRSFDLTNLNDWTSKYIEESRSRLERGVPIVRNLF